MDSDDQSPHLVRVTTLLPLGRGGNTVALTKYQRHQFTHMYSMSPFGNVLDEHEADANPFKFVGAFGVMEETEGLYFMRARYSTWLIRAGSSGGIPTGVLSSTSTPIATLWHMSMRMACGLNNSRVRHVRYGIGQGHGDS